MRVLSTVCRSAVEEDRLPVGRPDFKSGEGRSTSLVGSTPTLFRQPSRRAGPSLPGPVPSLPGGRAETATGGRPVEGGGGGGKGQANRRAP